MSRQQSLMFRSLISSLCSSILCLLAALPGHAQQQAMPVITETVAKETVSLPRTFSGRLTAVEYALLLPQVSGQITEVRFEDSAEVEEGDVLFVIDPRTYKAAQQLAEAEVEAARSQLELARKEEKRAAELVTTKALSQSVFDSRANNSALARAALEAAEAQLAQAEVNIDHAYVKAPFDGVAGRAEVTKGNYVQAGAGAPVLTSVLASKGLYADFDIDEATFRQLSLPMTAAALEEAALPVDVRVRGQKHQAVLHSVDNRIDPASGTVRARAYLKNPPPSLLPGMYADVRLADTDGRPRVLVSEQAIGTNQDRKFVYVIKDGKATPQPVKLGGQLGKRRVITEGLDGGETIISEGIIRVRPGMPVQPKEAADSSAQQQ